MANPLNIQLYYRCEECKNASDEHGRGCKVNLLTPVLLAMENKARCPWWESKYSNKQSNNQTDNDYVKDL